MAGAYRLALTRTKVTPQQDGVPSGPPWTQVAVTVRDGVAELRRGNLTVASMAASDVLPAGRRVYTVVGEGGVSWLVERAGCNCGGGR